MTRIGYRESITIGYIPLPERERDFESGSSSLVWGEGVRG